MSPDAFFKRVLIPVDGSRRSLNAARYGLRLAGHENSEVIGVHVVDEENAADLALYSDQPVEEIQERMTRCGEGYIEEIREIAHRHRVRFVGEVRVGIPHRTILALAMEREADLIVMGTVGRKGPRRVLIGSVTERLIEQSPVPVLVIK